MSAADSLFLRSTLELAESGRFSCAPNPVVGCLIVQAGEIIGRGYHQLAGQGHAEVNALADAAAHGRDVAGATVYVSLEPCAFVGRTPACANTLVAANVARVVIAALDPHPKVAGAGMQILQNAGIETLLIDLPEAQTAIRGYVSRVVNKRPWVRIKSASSLDGATALANGDSKWITGEAARHEVQYWRARSDAVITGRGTVLADNPALTVRAAAYQHARPPLRVVLDTHLQLPPGLQVFASGAPTLVVHGEKLVAPTRPAAQPGDDAGEVGAVAWLALPVDAQHGGIALAPLLAALAERGCNEVLVEAGARLLGAFAAQGLWDEWCCYVAPKWLGSDIRGVVDFKIDQLAKAVDAKVVAVTTVGEDLCIQLERA